jgi:MFS family permease
VHHAVFVSDRADVRSATRATHVAFNAVGFALATWLSRIPGIKEQLRLDPSTLGLVLLAGSVGSVGGLLLAGPAVIRFGSRGVVAAGAVIAGAGLVTIAVGYRAGVVPVAGGLFTFGIGQGSWDVAMNVQGAVVEQRLGRPVLSRFHASYSVGTVAGGLVGAALVALHAPLAVHLTLVGVAMGVTIPLAVRGFLPSGPAADTTAAPLKAWREPRTLLIGVFIFAFALAGGTGVDWISVALINDYRTSTSTGALGTAGFLALMTISRRFAPALIERYGRVGVVRVLGIVSILGIVLFASRIATPLALFGALLWGAGVSLGFPVGLSAAADEPARAAARVSVCSSIGFTAFLAGPSLIGFLGNQFGVAHAVAGVIPLLAVAVLIAAVVHPPSVRNPADKAAPFPGQSAQ